MLLNAHNSTLHGGTGQVAAFNGNRFWISSCRDLVRKTTLSFVKCKWFTVKPSFPLIGNLLKERVDLPSKVFLKVGLDFAGPFPCEKTPQNVEKTYMALFVGFASRAVHIEAVTNMTTPACIAALRRFVSRPGCPTPLGTDSDSNFLGAKSEIAAKQKVLYTNHADSLQAKAAGINMIWNVKPPQASHFGGLWESNIKSAKRRTERIMRNQFMSCEELTTLFCQIELVFNSRPISQFLENHNDSEILTPARFCRGGKFETLLLIESNDNIKTSSSSIKKWFQLQSLLSSFWRRWSKEYVTS